MQRGRVHTELPLGHDELAEELVAARVDPIGLCLICGEDFYSEDDCIEGSWIHACPANIASLEPRVGIFFVLAGDSLIVDGTPLSQAIPYGDEHLTHEKGHLTFWSELQAAHLVPEEVEYDEVARGRVSYSTKDKKFSILVDPCIMKDRRTLGRINDQLQLNDSATGPARRDPHYKCRACLGADWVPLLETENYDIQEPR